LSCNASAFPRQIARHLALTTSAWFAVMSIGDFELPAIWPSAGAAPAISASVREAAQKWLFG